MRRRRVIALDLPTEDTAVREIMTSDPATVGLDESAMDALGLMLEKRTRHLPVRNKPLYRNLTHTSTVYVLIFSISSGLHLVLTVLFNILMNA